MLIRATFSNLQRKRVRMHSDIARKLLDRRVCIWLDLLSYFLSIPLVHYVSLFCSSGWDCLALQKIKVPK